MFKLVKKSELYKYNLIVLISVAMLVIVYANSGTAIILNKPVSYVDKWFDKISSFAASKKLLLQIANSQGQNLKNVIDDIGNPYEKDDKAIKIGKRNYTLKGCGSLHCHGAKGKGSGGPALNLGKFKYSDGSNFALLEIITNGIKGTRMNAYGNKMSPDDILMIIAYLRWETKKLKGL